MDHLYYKSGALYSACSENKKEYFYENGKIKTIERYLNGKLDGISLLYWPNGTLKRECLFVSGLREGFDRMWNEEGVLVDEGEYRKGKPIGKHRRFNGKGGMIEEIEYLDEGRFNLFQWNDEGELRVEAVWAGRSAYREKSWDRFQHVWVEKEGYWDGQKLVYL